MVYVSSFSRYTSSSVKSIFINTSYNNSIPNKCTINNIINTIVENNKEYELIKQLTTNKTIIDITRYYTNFSLGNFDLLINELNPITYSRMSKELVNLHVGSQHTEYEFILTNIIRSFESLMQSVDLYTKLQNANKNLTYLSDRVIILDDRVKLQKYIDELNNKANFSILPEINIEAPLFILKKEYEIYIKLYGFPSGGVFNSELLGEIINTMNSKPTKN
jgi:hypothetical protein